MLAQNVVQIETDGDIDLGKATGPVRKTIFLLYAISNLTDAFTTL